MMRGLFLLAIALLCSAYAQNVHQVTRLLRQQNDWATSHNHSHLLSLSQTNDFFSFDDFLDVIDADRSDSLSPDCKEDMHDLISGRLGKLPYSDFAEKVLLPMRDSAGKMHGAILKGHIYFAGHFSECVQIDAKLTGRERPFKADYFKVTVDVLLKPSANWSCEVTDAGAAFGWTLGLCLPASCSSAELESVFVDESSKHNPVCKIERTNDSIGALDAGFYVTVSIMCVIFSACIVSGLTDFFASDYLSCKPLSRSLIWRSFMSFSLYANVASIFDTSGSKKEGQIAPIHCVRFFSMCWVVLGHLTGSFIAIIANPLDVLALTDDLTTEFILNAFFSVDSFFFVGGLLLTFLWFKNYYRSPKLTNSPGAWFMFYVHRILRLSPPYFMMVIFFTFVLPKFYWNSPFNMNALTQATDNCRETWWLEFTYMHNIIEEHKQCLGYSWYLAADTQIFFFTPLIILPLAYSPALGILVAAVLFTLSSAVNIFLVYHYHWPATLQIVGPTDPNMTNFDDYELYMYFSPITRCQVYIIGMLVGWLLQSKKRLRINPYINLIGWMSCFALMLFLILGLHSQTTGTLIPIFWRAMYSAFSKPAWALCLSWIIVSCYYGYGGPINSFMSWHVWVPLGRLSYCGYLVHYPMIYIVMAQIHDEIYFSSFINYVITALIPLIVLTYIISIFWSACFEISFGKLEMLLIGGARGKVKEADTAPVKRKTSNDDVERSDEVVYVNNEKIAEEFDNTDDDKIRL